MALAFHEHPNPSGFRGGASVLDRRAAIRAEKDGMTKL
jgi:hypothetical protein